jgi:endoglucanase
VKRRQGPGRGFTVAGILVASLCIATAADAPRAIRVDQIGYRPGDPKVGLVVGTTSSSFTVRRVDTKQVAFEGTFGPPGERDPASGDRVAVLDFTPLRTEGEYVITTVDGLSSPVFRVGSAVYDEAFRAVLKSFLYQRCGTPIADGSPFARPACHLADAREWGPGGVQRAVTGGWHDAGDYGKYVVPAGLTLWHLGMIAGLPGSAVTPDLLNEMRWELDWLLKMQREDGGVHHKVGPTRWAGDHAPQDDREPRLLYPVSSAATANFAAATAQAARLFESADPVYARRLLGAAETARRWLEQHPTIVPPGGFKDLPGDEGGSGAYGDDDDRDERFWAAAELWRTTGNPRYRAAFTEALRRWTPFDYPASWLHVQNLAFLTLLDPAGPLDAASRASLVGLLDAKAGETIRTLARAGYRVALAPNDYYWGSNGVVLERAVALLMAFRATGRPAFREAGLDQLHYILGRNSLGKSYVTGLGSDPPRRPYHQPSLTHPSRLVPAGLVVGGPNAQGAGVRQAFPARAYLDQEKLYVVNEPAVYWTAALAHVLALVQLAQ